MFRVTSPARSGRIPATARLRRVLRIDPGEDLWVELGFYAGPRRMRTTLEKMWKGAVFRRVVGEAESLSSRRTGSWTVDVAELSPV